MGRTQRVRAGLGGLGPTAAMKKLSKRAKRRNKEDAGARIAAQEEALLASADEPQSAEDFDRLLVGALPFGVGRGGHAGLRGSRMCDGAWSVNALLAASVAQLVAALDQVHGVRDWPDRA